MKTLLKLLVVALFLNAAVRVGAATWRYYDFKDAVEQAARFDEEKTAEKLQQRILALAQERGIEIYPDDLTVQKDNTQTIVSALYAEQIELVPRLYTREHLFEFEVTVHPPRPIPLGSDR